MLARALVLAWPFREATLRKRWEGPGGGREVLLMAYPLILGHMSFTIQTFVDRLFLTWYSAEAVAGAVTSLFTVWSLIALFTGTGEYLTTFVAHYFGAGRPERIGPAVWQGVYFSLAAGALVAALAPLAEPIFAFAGHDPRVRAHEVEYARILMVGAFPVVLMASPRFREAYRTLSGWRFEAPLFGRLLRFGMPTGLQYSIEVGAFALFMMIVGRIGTEPLAASGIAFNLNMIVFMPMVGLAVAVSSLVGRYLGSGKPELAERTVYSAFGMSLLYVLACGALYVFGSGPLLAPYAAGADPAAFAGVAEIARVLLRFVAVYSIFDMMNLIFAAGLKGAGDTVYPLGLTVVLSWSAMLLPGYVACVLLGGGVYVAWSAASAYVILLGLLMVGRFRSGRWKSLRVIEERAPGL